MKAAPLKWGDKVKVTLPDNYQTSMEMNAIVVGEFVEVRLEGATSTKLVPREDVKKARW